MATSTNSTVQSLMDEVENLAADDNSLEAKLMMIAQKVAEEQQKVKAALTGSSNQLQPELVDPADAFACEGCQ